MENNLSPINGLWFGNPLSTLEIMSMVSFLRNGHEYNLYVYEDLQNIPDGVNVKDANQIVPKEQIFKSLDSEGKPGSLAPFADYFRYKLIYENGGYWADMDCICIKPWDFEDDFVFSSENTHRGEQEANIGVIKTPINHNVLKYCMNKIDSFPDKTQIPWGFSGPVLLREAISHFGLESYVKSWGTFMPINWWEINRCFIPNYDFNITDEMYCIHINNEIIRRMGLDKNGEYPQSSIYEQLKNWIL